MTLFAMEERVDFCKTMTGMFEEGELNEKLEIFIDEAHFCLNGDVNKQNYRFWSWENPPASQGLHLVKVTVRVAISVKGIYLQFLLSAFTGNGYKQLSKTNFFPCARKRGLIKAFYFMQDEAVPHRTQGVLEKIHEVYGTRVIIL